MTVGVAVSLWDDLVGQAQAVAELRQAVSGAAHAMTHAWLITGPPGSGRSNAARAFAAALQCPDGGCGACQTCRTCLSGAHPDVTLMRTEQLSIGVDEVRRLVRRASMAPTLGSRQVLIVEDADRVTERGADALLKAVEEPARRTVWLLCAPTADDVQVTIRSRCRQVNLVTPSDRAVADLLVRRDGLDRPRAEFVARLAQGHIGRARGLARDGQAMRRRRDVLQAVSRLTGLGQCLRQAERLISTTQDEVASAVAELDRREREELSGTLVSGRGPKVRHAAVALKELADQQQLRAKRLQRDGLDAALGQLTSYYRDVLVRQTGAGAGLINLDFEEEIAELARRTSPETTVARLDAILACRVALEGNVAPLLAVEALFVSLM
ncbi:MAG: DNA polymerase III subunit delta' [Propionibacteriaceae bacterium]|jgi:DNA polymerase-3 subunit delta'|nr:DNA polymerase III subunit delta' [Propionibacteriaceae bacterium]